MDELVSANGHTADAEEVSVSANPYRDTLSDRRPKEIVEFELNTDPYANMLPRVSSVTRSALPEEDSTARRRSPLLLVVSIVLIVVLVLPVMAEVFARLIH